MPIIVASPAPPVPLRGYRVDRQALHTIREEWAAALPSGSVTSPDELDRALDSRLTRIKLTARGQGSHRQACLEMDTEARTATLTMGDADGLDCPTQHMWELGRLSRNPHAFVVDRRSPEKQESDRRWRIGIALTIAGLAIAVIVPLLIGQA